jgi:hypothetical protein
MALAMLSRRIGRDKPAWRGGVQYMAHMASTSHSALKPERASVDAKADTASAEVPMASVRKGA